MSYVLCFTYIILCSMFYVLYLMFYVLCFIFYVLCFMFYVLRFMFYVLCYVLRLRFYVLYFGCSCFNLVHFIFLRSSLSKPSCCRIMGCFYGKMLSTIGESCDSGVGIVSVYIIYKNKNFEVLIYGLITQLSCCF